MCVNAPLFIALRALLTPIGIVRMYFKSLSFYVMYASEFVTNLVNLSMLWVSITGFNHIYSVFDYHSGKQDYKQDLRCGMNQTRVPTIGVI